MDFSPFISPDHETSVFKNIPIQYYNRNVLKDLQKICGNIRVRFRGPRPSSANRNRDQRKSDCLRKDAEYFSVYLANYK